MALGVLWPCRGAHGGGTGVALGGQEGWGTVGQGMGHGRGDGAGRQRVLHPHPTESLWALQGSPGQVRAQGRSRGQAVTPGLCLPRGDSRSRMQRIQP